MTPPDLKSTPEVLKQNMVGYMEATHEACPDMTPQDLMASTLFVFWMPTAILKACGKQIRWQAKQVVRSVVRRISS